MLHGKLRLVVAVVLVSPWVRSLHAQVGEAWVSTYDGPAHHDDLVRAMAVDPAGNVYVTGWSRTGNRVHNDPGHAFEGDFATVKLDPSGHSLWDERVDSSGADPVDDSPVAMALGSDGRLHVLGSTGSGREQDVLTVTYEADGSERWRDTFGEVGFNDEPGAIAADDAGNVFVTSNSDSFVFTIKYDSEGNRDWVAQSPLANGSTSHLTGVQATEEGDVYVLGHLGLESDTIGVFLLIKYDLDGNEAWTRRHRVPETSWASFSSLALNAVGAAVTGSFMLPGQGSVMETVQYDADGNEVWAATRQESSSSYDAGLKVHTDGEGNVIVAGRTCPDGTCRPLLVRYDDVGNEQWSKVLRDERLPALAVGRASAVAIDGEGSFYLTGALVGAEGRSETTTAKFDRDGNRAWIAQRSRAGASDSRGVAIALDPKGSILVAEEASVPGDWHDMGVVKYVQGPGVTAFSRGDANDDGARDIADAVSILNALFAGGPQPGCAASADANGDAAVDLSDAVYLLAYLFQGGTAPPAPFPDCGTAVGDPGCAAFAACKA